MDRMFTPLTTAALPAILALLQQLASRGPIKFTANDWNVPVTRDMSCRYGQGGIECELAGSVSMAILPSTPEEQTFYRIVDGAIEFQVFVSSSPTPLRRRFESAN